MDNTNLALGRLKRRGLVAGAAALCGAVLAKLAGPERVEAGHDGAAPYSAANVLHLGVINDGGNAADTGFATSLGAETQVVANTSGRVLLLRNLGGGGGLAVRCSLGASDGGTAIGATGGTVNAGPNPGGTGLFVTGGDVEGSGSGSPGNGITAFGGIVDKTMPFLQPDPGTTGGIGVEGFGRGFGDFGNHGVYGETNSSAAFGTAGVFGNNIGSGPGVAGVSDEGTGSGIGVKGLAGGGTGVLGISTTGTGVHGTSQGNFTQGVLGAGTGQAHGVTGTSVNAFGVSGTSSNAKGFVGVNTAGNDFAGLFVGHGANPNNFNAPGIYVKGRAVITGGISASALTSQGPQLLHGIQAADELHEDVGRGNLTNGRARVSLDPLFAETIKTDDYHVFLTPRSAASRGLAVTGQDARGFTVEELGGGTGSYAFDWRVVAECKGAPARSRLARADDPDLPRVLERLPGPATDPPTADPTPPPPSRPTPPSRR